jgi:restriction endonuclease Mrr
MTSSSSGLEKVYVQAKRWQESVGRPVVQAFYGAIAGQHATKGVMIATSTFTPQAIDFAKSVQQLVLVDGAKLTELTTKSESRCAQSEYPSSIRTTLMSSKLGARAARSVFGGT